MNPKQDCPCTVLVQQTNVLRKLYNSKQVLDDKDTRREGPYIDPSVLLDKHTNRFSSLRGNFYGFPTLSGISHFFLRPYV